ncbi:MAG: Type II secretion system protein E (GspE) [Candidatus Woesebacteria bacterium GW2011_GWC1_38_13]|uniref:Type II secretion system protein E (GspE) n=1 Tax=Candidatus Woesebacteria bacterium GW2011_GWC1_38_13 TaxID=1618583 RepID=A0A0G0IYF0_9BACT|nr:MAG: Type II secretion system protein E (GspE) [Candidatus Woesebacteria bacterium GW2011_GWC1_38_13]KKQ76665.1 MAG: Type II secretion system protein E (GspE) [Microgenomates group bacterium GW2011_GWF1_38_5]
MPINHDVLRNLLEGSGFVKQTDLDDAFKVSAHLGCDVSDVLLGRNLISEDNYGQILATYYNISFINLDKIEIPHSVINQIPEDLAAEKMAIVFENKDGVLGVAMQDPQDLETIEMIRKTVGSGYQLVIYVATSTALKNALKAYKERTASVQTDDVMKVDDTNLSAIALVENFLDYAVREEASDIHIEPIPEHLLVRIRVDGVLQDHKVFPIKLHSPITARIKILSSLKIDEQRLPQDGQFSYQTKTGQKISLRVSIIPTVYGEKTVLRILQTQLTKFNLDELGFLPEDQQAVGRILTRTHGMFLVTGPTGSGKTTTLYTILGILNRPDINIVTIEDPVENKIHRVNQIQVNSDINLTFASGLRSILRQDPDIVMVGEIRDKETSVIAINAAMTGHLVFSSVHANNASGAIPRMLDLGCEPFLLASTLNMVIAQRLVRILCPKCRESVPISDVILNRLQEVRGGISEGVRNALTNNFVPKGCSHCLNTGFRGRCGIFEILLIDDDIKKLIVEKASSDAIWDVARTKGPKSMLEDGLIKVSKGITSIEEVFRVISE